VHSSLCVLELLQKLDIMKQENNVIEVSKRLKAVRRELDISQKDFAARIDVSGSYLSEIESGKTKPGYNFLIAIAKEFRVSPSWLLLEEGEMFLGNDPGSSISMGENEFGDQTGRVKELLLYLKRSPLVQSTILSYAGKFFLENEESIRKDIEKNEAKKTGNSQ